MKGAAGVLLVCGIVVVVGVTLFVSGPITKLAFAGSGQMAIVPPADPIAADCGQAGSIADHACNVEVQEYDAVTMLLLWGGGALLLTCAVGFILFAVCLLGAVR